MRVYLFCSGQIIKENGVKFKYTYESSTNYYHKRLICSQQDCTRRATNSEQKLCFKHGGNVPICLEPECQSRVCFRTLFCRKHGGGYLCAHFHGCTRQGIPQLGYKCLRHTRDELKKKHYAYKLKLLQTNIKVRIKERLRSRLRCALKQHHKCAPTMELVGCTADFLKQYLESKFQDGMNWDNYGRKEGIKCWEIDHIRPCASFDMGREEDQRKCFHYSNLQPLWAEDNLQKRDKWY